MDSSLRKHQQVLARNSGWLSRQDDTYRRKLLHMRWQPNALNCPDDKDNEFMGQFGYELLICLDKDGSPWYMYVMLGLEKRVPQYS